MTHQQLYINIHHVNSKVQNCYQTGETFPLNKGGSCVPADHKRPQWMVIRSSHWEARRAQGQILLPLIVPRWHQNRTTGTLPTSRNTTLVLLGIKCLQMMCG